MSGISVEFNWQSWLQTDLGRHVKKAFGSTCLYYHPRAGNNSLLPSSRPTIMFTSVLAAITTWQDPRATTLLWLALYRRYEAEEEEPEALHTRNTFTAEHEYHSKVARTANNTDAPQTVTFHESWSTKCSRKELSYENKGKKKVPEWQNKMGGRGGDKPTSNASSHGTSCDSKLHVTKKNRACHVSWCTIILIQVEREAGGRGERGCCIKELTKGNPVLMQP